MAKKVKAIIKLQIPAGKANPAPPVGPALGQHGLNIMEFVKQYNERTSRDVGMIIPVEITVYEDKTFSLLLKEAGIEHGSSEPNKTKVGKVTSAQIRKIAEIKMKDLNANDIEAAMKIIAGTARSAGIVVED